MDKIKDFFNQRAANWDEHSIADKVKMEYILDKSCIQENAKILDIACGTGVMDEFLLARNPHSILAVDIAENMIHQAKLKYDDARITFKTQDVMNINNQEFDFIIVYNAFPHFLEPEFFLKKVHSLLTKNGRFIICHGMGRRDLNDHHKRKASEISLGLAPANEVSKMLLNQGFKVNYIEDTKDIYIISSEK